MLNSPATERDIEKLYWLKNPLSVSKIAVDSAGRKRQSFTRQEATVWFNPET